jgi:multicomponent Na+:H+ antiporter subunit B
MTTGAPPRRRVVAALILVAGTATCLGAASVDLPRQDADLPGIARDAMSQALPRWHTTEVVNAIVYGTRGFDTFGETFLLLSAVVGVIVVCRGRERRRVFLQEERLGRREQAEARRAGAGPRGRGRRSDVERAEGLEQGQVEGSDRDLDRERRDERLGRRGPVSSAAMTVVVRAGTRTVLPVLAVAGVYLAAWGYSPGGGFPAGAVLAGVVLLAYAANGYRAVRRFVRPALLEVVELAGAAAIVAIEVLGLALKGSISANWLPLGTAKTIQGGGILQAFSGSELLEVGTGLLLVVFSLLAMETYLLLVSMAYRRGGTAPVLVDTPKGRSVESVVHGRVADPVLQNFCLTAIIIGVAVTGVFLAVVVGVAQHYRSLDADDVRVMRG